MSENQKSKPRRKTWIFILAVIVIAAILIYAFSDDEDGVVNRGFRVIGRILHLIGRIL